MEQIWIDRPGDESVLSIRPAPDPDPGAGEVRVAVEGIGINFADIMARMGMYRDAPRLPCVVGYEVSGIVERCGEGVAGFATGDRVFGVTRFGGYATKVCVPEEQLFPVPDGLETVDAAAIPVNYFTAYLAVVLMGNLQAGERVLIHNAGGGVGVAAVELARTVGAEIYGTASVSKHGFLSEMGCAHLIDYRTVDFAREIDRLTGGKGVHLVLDPLGGRSVKKDYGVLAPLGRIVMYGVSSASRGRKGSLMRLIRTALSFPRFHPVPLMNRNQGVFGLNFGRLWGELPRLRFVAEEIIRHVEAGHLAPRARHRFGFSDVQAAHRFVQDRKNTGKVVLTVS